MSTMSGLSDINICGCYYIVEYERQYLPQVVLESHTTISPLSFTTQLNQTFSNPSTENLPKVRYCFPLYDGVAVSGYTITYAGETLRGIVKQKDDAKTIYRTAVDRGDTAGLLEALPAGIFGVTLGNVPPGQDITVTISYCGELRHDSQIDGLRYTLPTSIAPRYGSYPGNLLQSNVRTDGGIRISVDLDMAVSAIRKVQSPSHPLAVSIGQLSNPEASGSFSSSKASATLSLGSAELAQDFVLQILVDNVGDPKSVVETHPTLPNHRAIMTTLVPKFTLKPANSEIIFIADQSGSMEGPKNKALVAALKIFLRSLPLGVRFNICAFGSSFQFLWPKSLAFSEDNFNTALVFVDTFDARLGGTELLQPIQQAFERHLNDLSLEVMLLTDGQVWGESKVFDFINQQIIEKGVDARVFALGIGEDVSHTLVEGIARAGNGFAQFTQTEAEIDQKIVRMLKGALYAHTKDYTLKVHYEEANAMSDDGDFEIVEKPSNLVEEAAEEGRTSTAKAKSFFDPSADLDKSVAPAGRYAHLPEIQTPAVIQAPTSIPPLFPFNRTNVYLLLGPESPQKHISHITLRATSSEGPIELDIPVHTVEVGTSIHQLAARKAIQDLEEGRGWLQTAIVKDAVGTETMPAREKYESRFDEIVEREAVRLGEAFCVAGKFTSFVAVSDQNSENAEEIVLQAADPRFTKKRKVSSRMARARRVEMPISQTSDATVNMLPPVPRASYRMTSVSKAAVCRPSGSLGSSFGSAAFSGRFGSAATNDTGHLNGLFGSAAKKDTDHLKDGNVIHEIISLQTFAGAWIWGTDLLRLVGKAESQVDINKLGNDKDVAATVLAVAFMESTLRASKDTWELVVNKARMWLGKKMGGDNKAVEALIRAAAEGFRSS
ncbi:related to Vault poly[ADP-ribose] polymerase [Ramularia collo-cygni]|uniref:Related to Vault poly[ADP-ribose] polymerase n=1 Tax=Ramularia collo-cygni TaxID=112498 RepID=A0A2D3VIN7_9PEZI|nr:related to Vault poly[ADP-ribose] polymerase [Ramularia collo-cygni]CZT25282.1 related to Vault poly[ADP-ribose] polymerase [Ramularia collo-cygni]